MLTISKPLSSGQAQAYHKEEFADARDNYYSEGDRVRGEWHGKLAAQWGLKGEVNEGQGVGARGQPELVRYLFCERQVELHRGMPIQIGGTGGAQAAEDNAGKAGLRALGGILSFLYWRF